VTPLRALVVVLAGFGGGALTAVVGAGSLASLPVLLAIGLPPVTANVTSAVGVVPGSAAGVYAYRHQLPALRRLLAPMLVPTVLGGVAGALLLLVLPASTFETLLPGLLLMAAALVAVQPRIARAVARRQARVGARAVGSAGGADDEQTTDDASASGPTAGPVVLSLGVLVAVYGGYFGAAVSVLYLAMLGSIVGGLQASNGAKNTLTGLSCGAACVVFVLRAHPDWAAVGLLAVGSTIGGLLAGRYGQRLPDDVLRVALIVIAVVTAAVEATR
jgi:uncharacterized membrane protein YfcA